MIDSFEAVLADVSDRLGAAAKSRKLPMQSPVVATADADARIMILRAFDANAWSLRFHTDLRAPKCKIIGSGAPVGVLFYDKPEKVQIRARGIGRIETDTPLADEAWAQSTNFARRCYLGEGPGGASDKPSSGLPAEFEGVEPTEEQVLPARANFAVLVIELKELDWFYLAHTGHLRAQLDRGERGWEGRWVTP